MGNIFVSKQCVQLILKDVFNRNLKKKTSYQNYYAGHINKHGWANKVKESFWPNMIAASDVYECDHNRDFLPCRSTGFEGVSMNGFTRQF